MFRYEYFEPEHFLEFLKQGIFDEDINEVVKRFSLYEPLVQFELINYLRNKNLPNLSLKIFSQALGISQKDGRHILNANGKIFKLILSGDKKYRITAKLTRALVIPGTSKIVTNNEHIKRYLSVVKKFTGKNFAVFFEEDFIGSSFMLPLAVSLYVENIPENLVFTGKIDAKGNIFEVEDINKKFAVVKKKGLKLITPSQVGHIDTIKAFLDRKSWNLPFYVTSESLQEIKVFLSFVPEEKISKELSFFKGLELFYNISEDNFCITTGQLKEKGEWEKVCINFYKNIQLLKIKLPGEKTFHFGIRGPASLAFPLGIVFGSQDPFIIYHYQGGKYYPVKVLNPREIKERVSSFKNIKYEFEKRNEELVIMLDLAHHEIFADVKTYAESILNNPSYLVICHELAGNLPIDKFKEIVKESASLIQSLKRKYSFLSFHFFFSCPVAIAFMLGIAFGHYEKGWVYNYQQQEKKYLPVINFDILRKIREGDVRF